MDAPAQAALFSDRRPGTSRCGLSHMLPSAMMKVPATSNSTKQLFDTIAKALAVRGAVSGAMFGMPTLKAGPKAFAGIFGDSLVFKLSGQAHADACKLKGAKAFDPSGMG